MNYVKSLDLFGVEVQQIPNILGSGAPTTTTEGAVGCLYMDTASENGDMYKCIAVADNAYTWAPCTSVEGAVLYTEQTLTPEQQSQARVNIAAGSSELYDTIVPIGELVENTYIYASGGSGSSDSTNSTDFIEVNAGERLHIVGLWAEGPRAVCGYNTAEQMVECYLTGSSETELTIDIASNVKYIRFSCRKNVTPTVKKVSYPVNLEILKLQRAVGAATYSSRLKLSKLAWVNGKAFSANQNMIVDDGASILCETYFKVADYAIDNYITIESESNSGNTLHYCLAMYDENKEPTRRTSFNANPKLVNSGEAYFRISLRLFDASGNSVGGNYADYDLDNRYMPTSITEDILLELRDKCNENSEKLGVSEYLDYDTNFTVQDLADLASLTVSATYNNYYTRRPFNIVHCTDLHSRSNDIKCFQNAIKLLERNELDCMILSGDLVASHFTDENATLEAEWAKIAKDVIFTVGNHDVGNSYLVAESGTDAQVYNRYYTPHLLTNFMYDANTTLAAYNTANPSSNPMMNYYVDYSEYKLRIISMYQYNTNMEVDPADATKLKYFRGNKAYKQSDVDWLISTLNTTPDEYTVLFVTHEPENFGSKTNDWQSINMADSKVWRSEGALTKILTAYKKKVSINETYAQTSNIVTTLNLNADFTNANGEFGAWVCGHTHDDFVGKTANGELNLICKTCDNLLAQTDSSIKKTAGTPNENAINVISIDTEHKTITVKRIGAKFSRNGDWRNVISIMY